MFVCYGLYFVVVVSLLVWFTCCCACCCFRWMDVCCWFAYCGCLFVIRFLVYVDLIAVVVCLLFCLFGLIDWLLIVRSLSLFVVFMVAIVLLLFLVACFCLKFGLFTCGLRVLVTLVCLFWFCWLFCVYCCFGCLCGCLLRLVVMIALWLLLFCDCYCLGFVVLFDCLPLVGLVMCLGLVLCLEFKLLFASVNSVGYLFSFVLYILLIRFGDFNNFVLFGCCWCLWWCLFGC